jgi:hypothetical protein
VKIKRLKAEKAGDVAANKQLGKSIANPQPNDLVPEDKQLVKSNANPKSTDQVRETSTCEVPVQCSSIDHEPGKDLSKNSSLKPCSQPSLALDTEKNLHENPSIQDPVNLQHHVNPDQWHDAVEELQDAASGPTDITVDADVHRDLHQPDNTTESSNLGHRVERDDGTVCLIDTIEPQVLSEGGVDELQSVEAAGVATSSQVNENMKIPEKSEQADTERSEHLVDKSAESLPRDHEAGLLVLYSVNEDKPKAGDEDLHAVEQETQELVQDESIVVQPDPILRDGRTLSATADAISNTDTCEDGVIDPDLRIHAEGRLIATPTSSLLSSQPSGSRILGEAGDKQPETSTSTEDNAAPPNSEENAYELQRKTVENAVDTATPQKETDSEAGLSTQSHDNMGDAQVSHRIDESVADLAQDAKADEIVCSEPLSEISELHEDLPNAQVFKEVTTSGSDSAETGPEANTAAAEGVRMRIVTFFQCGT